MENGGDPKASKTVIVGIVGVILLLVVVLFATALFYDVENREIEQRVYNVPYEGLAKVSSEQLGNLNAYRWVNEKEGIAAIPIDEAIRLTVRDLKAAAATQRASQPAGRE